MRATPQGSWKHTPLPWQERLVMINSRCRERERESVCSRHSLPGQTDLCVIRIFEEKTRPPDDKVTHGKLCVLQLFFSIRVYYYYIYKNLSRVP